MSHDWEQLSQLVQLLLSNDLVLDILALHLRLDDLMQSLAIWDQVDLEVVGDPQTTVSQVGHIVLFVSSTIARYKVRDYMTDALLILNPMLAFSASFCLSFPS
jgi:hypothetical protein